MMLCDYAVVSESKLYISGGGWSVTGPQPVPSALAIKIDIPWDQTNRPFKIEVALLGQDGQPVLQPGPLGDAPVKIDGDVEVGRPPGVIPGSPIDLPLAFQMGPLSLPAGQRFVWQVSINGSTHEDWNVSFTTRPAPPTGGVGEVPRASL